MSAEIAKAEDIITKKFALLNKEDTLSKAISIFNHERPELIIITDENNNYQGIVSERWIYRSMLDPTQTKLKILVVNAPKITPDTPLNEVARKMVESSLQMLPVFDEKEEKVIGVVKDIDLLTKVVEEKYGNLNVIEFATTNLINLNKEDSVGKALATFRDNNISRAAVVQDGKPIGMITMHDIITKFLIPMDRPQRGEKTSRKISSTSLPVNELMNYPVIFVKVQAKTKAAIELMKKHKISGVLILNDDESIQGIVTKKDLLEAYVEFHRTTEEGFKIQYAGSFNKIDEFEMRKIDKTVNGFAEKMEKVLEKGHIIVHFKTIGNPKGDNIRFLIRMRVISPGKTYNANHEGFNALDVMQTLLDKIERIVLSDKEQDDEQRYKLDFQAGMWF